MKPVAYREELLHNFKKNETLNFLKIAFSFSVEQERSENSESWLTYFILYVDVFLHSCLNLKMISAVWLDKPIPLSHPLKKGEENQL